MHKNAKKQPITLGRFEDVTYDILVGPTVTVAEVEWCGFTAMGEARRQAGDQDDPIVGQTLAFGRALESLSEDLIRFGIQRSAH